MFLVLYVSLYHLTQHQEDSEDPVRVFYAHDSIRIFSWRDEFGVKESCLDSKDVVDFKLLLVSRILFRIRKKLFVFVLLIA
jgi:hypothetical protein